MKGKIYLWRLLEFDSKLVSEGERDGKIKPIVVKNTLEA